jgi:hypothetical protein
VENGWAYKLISVILVVLHKKGGTMPLVTIKTGLLDAEGHEEILVEYMCDAHDCPNIAVRVLGVIKELRTMAMVCEEHAPPRRPRAEPSGPKAEPSGPKD